MIEGILHHNAPPQPRQLGGPLFELHGRVVGVNAAIIAGAQGIGFAIPADTARRVVARRLTQGRVQRPYLGIAASQRPLGRRMVRFHNLVRKLAVEVLSGTPENPAAKSDLHVGD